MAAAVTSPSRTANVIPTFDPEMQLKRWNFVENCTCTHHKAIMYVDYDNALYLHFIKPTCNSVHSISREMEVSKLTLDMFIPLPNVAQGSATFFEAESYSLGIE